MKRFAAVLLTLAVLLCPSVRAAGPGISAASAILIDGESGRVLYAQNAEEERPIASITKLMTALVAVESHPDLSEVVTIRPEWTGVEGSSMYLKAGEELTLEALLYGLLLASGNDAAVDMGVGASYKTIFTKPVTLEEGDYLLSTGNRRSDGAVLADLVSFQVEAGKLTNIDMLIRPCVEKMEILGVVPTALSIVPEGKTKPEAIRLPEKGYTAIALIEANKEPTNHLLRDMSGMKDDFENLGVPLYFVFKDADHQAKFNRADFRAFPSVMRWGTDLDGRLLKGLAEGLRLTNTESLPLIVLLNAKGEVVFVSQGYRVGLGTQIMNIISRK